MDAFIGLGAVFGGQRSDFQPPEGLLEGLHAGRPENFRVRIRAQLRQAHGSRATESSSSPHFGRIGGQPDRAVL